VKQVGRETGRALVLEGRCAKAAGNSHHRAKCDRTTGQTSGRTGSRGTSLTTCSALQDEVTVAVVTHAVQPKLLQQKFGIGDAARPETSPPMISISCSAAFLPSRPAKGLPRRSGWRHRALELDPRSALVAALAGVCHMRNVLFGYSLPDPQATCKELRLLFVWP